MRESAIKDREHRIRRARLKCARQSALAVPYSLRSTYSHVGRDVQVQVKEVVGVVPTLHPSEALQGRRRVRAADTVARLPRR